MSGNEEEEYPPPYAAAKRHRTIHEEAGSNGSIQEINMSLSGQIVGLVSVLVTLTLCCNYFYSVANFFQCYVTTLILLQQEIFDYNAISISDMEKKPSAGTYVEKIRDHSLNGKQWQI